MPTSPAQGMPASPGVLDEAPFELPVCWIDTGGSKAFVLFSISADRRDICPLTSTQCNGARFRVESTEWYFLRRTSVEMSAQAAEELRDIHND